MEILDSEEESDWDPTAATPDVTNWTRTTRESSKERYPLTRNGSLSSLSHASGSPSVAASNSLQISDEDDNASPDPTPT